MARVSMVLSVAVVLGVAACSWARFDDVSDNAPVLLFTKPGNVSYGFGSSVASGEVDGFYRVYVGASPGRTGGAEFELGPGQGAGADAVRSGHCGLGCTLAKSAAPLRRAILEAKEHTLCFAEGLGTGGGQKPLGIQIQCAGEPAYLSTNELPAGSQLTAESARYLSLAAPAVDFPILLAGTPAHQVDVGGTLVDQPAAAWFYASQSQTPVALDPGPGAQGTFGSALAVVSMGGAQWLAVGEPGQGRVYLFDSSGALQGCLAPGIAGFGRTLAAGRVDKDADQELVVASDGKVHVLSGAVLAGAADPSCGALPAGAEIVALSCRTTSDLDGCGSSQFGAALAVADFDHDDDGEVLVGAPGMDVRDAGQGGAVFVFDVEPEHPDWMLEARFLSSAESGDRLGTAIGVVHQPDRDVFVAGAPGNGKAALFFCSKLLKGDRGSRCE